MLPHYWYSQCCRIGCCFKLSFTECLSSRRSQTTYTQSEIYLGRLGTQVISTYPPLFCRLPKHGQTKMHAWNTKKIETEFELCLDLHNTSLQFIHKVTSHITPFLGRLITRLDLHFAILHQMTKFIQYFTLDTGTKDVLYFWSYPSVLSHIYCIHKTTTHGLTTSLLKLLSMVSNASWTTIKKKNIRVYDS